MERVPRTALVTGGGRGIGAAIARRFAERGVNVRICGRDRERLEAVAAETGAEADVIDLLDRSAVDSYLERLCALSQPIDVLVNNAGVAMGAPIAAVSDALWDRTMELNVGVPFRLCRALLGPMVDRGWGRVINIASNAGLSGYAYTSAYCASKHALVGLTRALAADVARSGVTINAVCPGWTNTEMFDEAIARIARKTGRDEDQARDALVAQGPQRRVIEPEEVAYVVASLVDDNARGIHGQCLVVDGGQIMN